MKTTRRHWMRNVAAAAGGMVLLPTLLPRGVGSVRAAPSGSPRFVFVIEGNCVEPVAMLSPTARATLDAELAAPIEGARNWYRSYRQDDLLEIGTADLDQAKSLEALGRDLASRASVIYGLSNKAGGGGHTPHHGTLTCTRTVGGSPGGQSIDALLAANLADAHGTPFDAVRVGAGSAPLNGGTCAYRAGVPAAILQRPATAYQTYLGAVAGDPSAVDRAEMLAFAREDVEHALGESLAGATEREKLRTYLTSLEETERQLDALVSWDADPTRLPADPASDPRYTSSRHLDALGAQFSVASSALRLGLTNVAVITSATAGEFGGVSYPSLARPGVPTRRHDLHHESAGSAAHQDMIHEVSGSIVGHLAQLARDLAATPDGDGATLLDNTVILYFGDNGETHHSSASEFPVLALGGERLGFSHGRTLVYPRLGAPGHRRMSNLWLSLLSAAGYPQDTFGGEDFSRLVGGELPALRG